MLNGFTNGVRRIWITLAATVLLSSATGARAQDEVSVYAQAGDVTATSVVVWGRCNRGTNAYLVVDLATSSAFEDLSEFQDAEDLTAKLGPLVKVVTADTDYTGSFVAYGLRPDTTYYYRLRCVTRPANGLATAEMGPVGTFRTTPAADQEQAVRFVWGADLAGQGWGRNPDLQITTVDGENIRGGYVIYEVMRRLRPDFAVFQGDNIYADNAIPAEQEIPQEAGGGTWVNDPTKDFVAVTLEQFRENWRYNLGDEKLRRFLLETPIYVQWDDHEVTNNWYPGETLTAEPYNGIAADLLAERAKQALVEYNPIASNRIFRKYQYGQHLDLFLLDERSFRGPNPANSNPDGIEMLGQEQFAWLKRHLKASTATWKVISTHDPLSIVTGDEDDRDAWGQGAPEVLGREVQLSQLLKFIKDEGIKNVVYITSDVHYAAAISYDPQRAVFQDFNPFMEFVIGPVNAGVFGENALDASFGPQYDFLRAPSTEDLPQNAPPPNLHSFGAIEIDKTGQLTVRLIDITGEVLFKQVLGPVQ